MSSNQDILVIDTTVLLFDPKCLTAFPNALIYIPLSVVEELDQFRRQMNEAGRHARQVVNELDELRTQKIDQGIALGQGALVKFWIDHARHPKMPFHSDLGRSSNLVLSASLSIRDHHKGQKVVLVTNDSNLRLRASALSLETFAFQTEKDHQSELNENILELSLNDEDLANLNQYDYLPWGAERLPLYPNQHVLLKTDKKILTRFVGRSKILKRVESNSAWNITPRNLEQIAALDLLLDKTIDIVVLSGKAGTGKTLLALAAALDSLHGDEKRKILVSRPIIPMGKDLGYLPGDIEEKISPWMKPIFDNLEFLLSRGSKQPLPIKTVTQLKERGILELEALTYIRGRSIPNRFMIVDEAQNLTPLEVKTVITRVGDNTKLILTGDPNQIDNPYVDSATNGLTYVIDKLKPFEIAAHVVLQRGERSRLAELAANVL